MEVQLSGDNNNSNGIFSTDRMDRDYDVGGVIWMIFGLYTIM